MGHLRVGAHRNAVCVGLALAALCCGSPKAPDADAARQRAPVASDAAAQTTQRRSGAAPRPAPALEPWTHLGARYRVVRARPERVRVFWRDAEGTPYGTLARLWRARVAAEPVAPIAAINGGIFEPGLIPTGLYIEDHTRHTPLNLRDGRGNFFTKPNGVFAIDASGAHITPSQRFTPRSPRLAVQSGPLLVHNGRMAQRFSPKHPSRKARNAVGVTASGEVVLVVSDLEEEDAVLPNLHDLASALIALGCRDGLYLDGTISCGIDAAWQPPCTKRRRFASMLAVYPP